MAHRSKPSRRQALKYCVGGLAACMADVRLARAQEATEPTPDEPSRRRIRVMTSNVRYGSADDGENRWDLRKEMLAMVLRSERPDLIGCQEILPFQAEYLRQNLNDYSYVGRSRDLDDDHGEQCGIYFRSARFIDLETGHFWLSPHPEQPGSKAWDAALPRMATWVKLFDRQTQRAFVLVNTHFDHRGREARQRSAAVVRRFVNRYSGQYPVIVTGDFNCGEGSAPYRELVANGESNDSPLIDVYRQLHAERHADEGTYNGFEGRRDGERIDWILATDDWRPLLSHIVTTHVDGRYPSDHFPVSAELEYRGSSPESAN